jgi:hypothetical protein
MRESIGALPSAHRHGIGVPPRRENVLRLFSSRRHHHVEPPGDHGAGDVGRPTVDPASDDEVGQSGDRRDHGRDDHGEEDSPDRAVDPHGHRGEGPRPASVGASHSGAFLGCCITPVAKVICPGCTAIADGSKPRLRSSPTARTAPQASAYDATARPIL